MAVNFYDKVAKKFGGYHTPAKYITEYPDEEPEKVFKDKLLELSGKDKIVLDAGCGDGRFTLSIAKNFKKIVGNDTSKLMLNAALKLQTEKGIKNIEFIKERTEELEYPSNYFDIIYARRAIAIYPLFHKMLKPGGYFLAIGIGEKDTKDLKLVFGRGQNYGKWDESILKKEVEEIEKAGFEIIFAKEFFYNEYYASYRDLDVFLQGVPIFEDFDSEKDRQFLEAYTRRFKTEKGIKLPRHRVVTVARKPL